MAEEFGNKNIERVGKNCSYKAMFLKAWLRKSKNFKFINSFRIFFLIKVKNTDHYLYFYEKKT